MIELTAVVPRSGSRELDAVRVDSKEIVQSRYASYMSDESGLGPGLAETVFFPTTEKQVAEFLREMSARHVSVTVSGGRTGIVGGAVPEGGALLSLEMMNRIVGIRWDRGAGEWHVTVEPGIRLKEFQDRIARKDLDEMQISSDPNWEDYPRFRRETQRYFYPPDPTEDTASLGGTVATNASGARTYYFGRTGEYVRAIRIVLSSGDVLELRRGENIVDSSRLVRIKCLGSGDKTFQIPAYESPRVKSVAGYLCQKNMDLIDLFIGSEGTLGVITLIEVALSVAPEQSVMFLAFFPSEDNAIRFALRIRSLKPVSEYLTVYSLEYFDHNSLTFLRKMKEKGQVEIGIRLPTDDSAAAILCEFSYNDLPQAIRFLQKPLEEFGSSLDNAVSGVDAQAKEQLKELRHVVPEAINKIVAQRKSRIPGMHKIGTDTSVSDEKFEDMIEFYTALLKDSNLEYYMFGHIAENHLHVNLLPRNQQELTEAEKLAWKLAEKAVDLGGTISAEHGIGKMKKALLKIMFSDSEINQMVATKRALDPNLILSPGNIIQV